MSINTHKKTQKNVQNNIASNTDNISPEFNTYMLTHIGGLKNNQLDTDNEYTRQQKDLIDISKTTSFQRKQHNQSFDIPNAEFNTIQSQHPYGINMLSNNSDRGFDYRDYPEELEKKISYDPRMQYLHKKGLIGKEKLRYNTHYINVNSAFRNINTVNKIASSVKLNEDPFSFSGNSLLISMSDTSQFNLNDKITISGVSGNQIILRSNVTDDYGNDVNYFSLINDLQYMSVSAPNNMNINSAITSDIIDSYNDLTVDFSGFVGDTSTQWYFDLTKYKWSFTPIANTTNQLFSLYEVVFAHSWSKCTFTKNNDGTWTLDTYSPKNMLITQFTVDQYGTVISNLQALDETITLSNFDLVWGPGNDPNGALPPCRIPGAPAIDETQAGPGGIAAHPGISRQPGNYYGKGTEALISLNLFFPPKPPVSFYTMMEYIQKTQNILRPIFLSEMRNPNNNCKVFNALYNSAELENGITYPNSVRIITPERTVISTTSKIGNIALNLLNTTHRMFLTSIAIEKDLGIYNKSSSTATNILNPNKFYIELDIPYVKAVFSYTNPLYSGALLFIQYENTVSDITITYQHYGGLPIKYINAQYPIGFTCNTGYQYITDISPNKYIAITTNRVGFLAKNFGGKDIYIGLIDTIIQGYAQPNHYIIDLQYDYTNIVMIKMINSIFPVSQKIFMTGLTGGQKNTKFYWQNRSDGDYIYSIDIDAGNYTINEFKKIFESAVQRKYRYNNTTLTTQINYITVDIDEMTDKVTFSNYNYYEPGSTSVYLNQVKFGGQYYSELPDFVNIRPQFGSNDVMNNYYTYPSGAYYINFPNYNLTTLLNGIVININHPNHGLVIGSKITIMDSLDYGLIPAKYLNKTHIVTRVEQNSYDIIIYYINSNILEYKELPSQFNSNAVINVLPQFTTVGYPPTTTSKLMYKAAIDYDYKINGGNEIKILTPNPFRIRFDNQDTFGKILGFRNVGNISSITPYQTVITNDVLYESEDISNVLQSLSGVTSYDSSIKRIRSPLGFKGIPYIIIQCAELSNVGDFGRIKNFFYKINLGNKLDEIVYNTYVDTPIFYNDPVSHVNTLTIDITAPDGSYYDFNSQDHSFVLEIVTYDPIPEETSIRIN
jgi:hypothetical protein